mgnify:CR=1 FL=1
MRVKQYKGTIYGADLTAKERRAMNIEINRQIVEADRKYLNNVDAMILYFLHKHLGFGKRRLRRAWEQFTVIHDDLVNYYEMPDDDAWLADRKRLALTLRHGTRKKETAHEKRREKRLTYEKRYRHPVRPAFY